MIYVYFYVPPDSDIPEIVGSLTGNDSTEAIEKAKTYMPKEMKDKGYRIGGAQMDEKNTVNNHWDIKLSDLKVRRFDDNGPIG